MPNSHLSVYGVLPQIRSHISLPAFTSVVPLIWHTAPQLRSSCLTGKHEELQMRLSRGHRQMILENVKSTMRFE